MSDPQKLASTLGYGRTPSIYGSPVPADFGLNMGSLFTGINR